MISKFTINTDFNGIVIFEPTRLVEFYGGSIEEDTNIFEKMITTDDGDEVLEQGIVVPILAIDDAGYDIECYVNDNSVRAAEKLFLLLEPSHCVLKNRLVISDLAVLRDWSDNLGWTDISIPPGNYETIIRGFKDFSNGVIESCGYEIHFNSVDKLPKLTGTTDFNFKVL